MSIKLYVEGGGDSKALRTACRRGFRQLIEKAGIAGRMPRIVACGGRQDAYDSFAVAHGGGDGTPMLLVDAEERVTAAGPWAHLRSRDGWVCPTGVVDDQCHLMIQVMESWFLADTETLASFYGQQFQQSALPGHAHVEDIAKAEVLSSLKRATRQTQKGPYDKGRDSFEILGAIDPAVVENAAPSARRLFGVLRGGAEG